MLIELRSRYLSLLPLIVTNQNSRRVLWGIALVPHVSLTKEDIYFLLYHKVGPAKSGLVACSIRYVSYIFHTVAASFFLMAIWSMLNTSEFVRRILSFTYKYNISGLISVRKHRLVWKKKKRQLGIWRNKSPNNCKTPITHLTRHRNATFIVLDTSYRKYQLVMYAFNVCLSTHLLNVRHYSRLGWIGRTICLNG